MVSTRQRLINECSDAIFEILTKLPAKSLSRFKSVSKPWNALIQDLIFINSQLHHSKLKYHDERFAIIDSQLQDHIFNSCSSTAVRVFKEKLYRNNECLCSCNGLITYITTLNYLEHVVVCNPITKQTRFLPKPKFCQQFLPVRKVVVAIGYDSSSKKYKVVGWNVDMMNKYGIPQDKVEIFTLGDDDKYWRKIQVKLPLGRRENKYPFSSLVYANGFLYLCCLNYDLVIFSFKDETFRYLQLPNNLGVVGYDYPVYYELQGHLCLLQKESSRDFVSKIVKLWTLEQNEEWVYKEISLSLEDDCDYRKISAIRNGEILLQKGPESEPSYDIYRYDEHGKLSELIKTNGIESKLVDYFFAESLVRIPGTQLEISQGLGV